MRKISKEQADLKLNSKISAEHFVKNIFPLQSIRENHKKINDYWWVISKYQKLDEDFIEDFKDKLNWENILQYQVLSIEQIQKNIDIVKDFWQIICIYQELTEDFILKNKSKVDWELISTHQKLSNTFIRDHFSILNAPKLIQFQKLDEGLIYDISRCVIGNNGLWKLIARFQKLSSFSISSILYSMKNFRKDFVDEVVREICLKQKMSNDFISSYLDFLNVDYMSKNKKLDQDFISSIKTFKKIY